MTPRDQPAGRPFVVGVGASAGGVEALSAMVRALPADFSAVVLVVLHVSATAVSVLPQILDRAGPLPVLAARDGLIPLAGRIYVAPPDRHLLIDADRLHLALRPSDAKHRPSIDETFRSLARHDGPVAAVLLSGTGDDGARGMQAIAQAGGATIVQDPAEAPYPGMPNRALELAPASKVLPVAGIAAELVGLLRTAPHTSSARQPSDPEPTP